MTTHNGNNENNRHKSHVILTNFAVYTLLVFVVYNYFHKRRVKLQIIRVLFVQLNNSNRKIVWNDTYRTIDVIVVNEVVT